jgi:hypothetical protein
MLAYKSAGTTLPRNQVKAHVHYFSNPKQNKKGDKGEGMGSLIYYGRYLFSKK